MVGSLFSGDFGFSFYYITIERGAQYQIDTIFSTICNIYQKRGRNGLRGSRKPKSFTPFRNNPRRNNCGEYFQRMVQTTGISSTADPWGSGSS
jgi:hypothetical protein